LQFDYKRFIIDPKYNSYYYIRNYEPDKLDIMIYMGLTYNLYLYYLFLAEEEADTFPMNYTTDEDDIEGYNLLSAFCEYFNSLDHLFFKDEGAALMYHKDISSDLFSEGDKDHPHLRIEGQAYMYDNF